MEQNKTGFLQAMYATSTDPKTGEPLDRFGRPCSQSGLKQAILVGYYNNNPNYRKYEVVGKYQYMQYLGHRPSATFNTDACPLPVLPKYALPEYKKEPLSKIYVIVDPTVNSVQSEGYNILGRDWDAPDGTFTNGGFNRGTYLSRRIGEYEWMLENWKMRYHPDRSYKQYALSQEILDVSEVPMTVDQSERLNGCYAFAGKATDKYLSGLQVFDVNKKYIGDGINPNLFGKATLVHARIENGIYVKDPNAISLILPELRPQESITITRESLGNTEVKIWKNWTAIDPAAPNIGGDQQDPANQGDLVITATMGNYTPHYWMITLCENGTPFEKLPKIKVELGTQSTPWVGLKEDLIIPGWKVPGLTDFTQLIGMLGKDLSEDNLMQHLFVSPNDKDLTWQKSWVGATKCEDALGVRMLPCGHKLNNSLENNGRIFQFGERMAFGLYGDPYGKEVGAPAFYFNITHGAKTGTVVYDNVTNVPYDESIKFWQRNYRFCRPLTDAELGYRLYRDDANNKIVVAKIGDAAPAGATELPKGLLRGLAVRWMNEDRTKVMAPLSHLLSEIEKTKDGGAYDWVGFNNIEY